MKVLLLQVRGHAKAEAQEIVCFEEALGDYAENLDRHNLVSEPRLRWSDLDGVDLLLLGGAGAHTVTREYEFTPYLNEALERWIESGRTFFGSCYGHHVMAKLYGAEVIEDPATEEVGTFEVRLTEAGCNDPVFSGLPARFPAQLGHHDRVAGLPERLLELADSKRCRNQALRVKGRPAYSTQFHPELSLARMRDRLMMYRDGYLGSDVTLNGLLETLRPSPDSGRLLRRFVETYF